MESSACIGSAVGLLEADEGAGTELGSHPGTLSKEEVFDFCFYLLAVGILGSRLMYVIQNFSEFIGCGVPCDLLSYVP